ncbi:hypothetical protein TURU_136878 [Turdus rufiventris]|nr:hypothetical protein TURU_136878 [Turdus rufiventris]
MRRKYSNFTIINRTILTKILVRTRNAAYNQVQLIYGQRTPGVRNGVGNLENTDRIMARVRNGVGNLENPDRILDGVRNGVGNLENPNRILAGVWNGVGR